MELKRILSRLRKCVDDFDMIQDGDKIAVGLSGGKDSLTLLIALDALAKFYPKKFEVIAISLDLGFDKLDEPLYADAEKVAEVERLCAEKSIQLIIKPTDIAKILFDIRKEKNPCSLCAKMRRGALNTLAKELGCNKVALGHHNEDAVETFFLSLFYEGRIGCFKPVTHLSNIDLHVIRPLLYVSEDYTIGYAKSANLPIVHNPCPADGYTKRQTMKEFVRDKTREDESFKMRVTGAIRKDIWGTTEV